MHTGRDVITEGDKSTMPEGNEVHRFRDRQAAIFAGRSLRADSPSGQFPDAELLDGRKLRGIVAHGKHLGYEFARDLILHVHLGRFGDFTEGKGPLAAPKGALRLRMWTKSKGETNWLELRGPSDCSIYDRKKWERLMARLGPDPLETGSDPEAGVRKDCGEQSAHRHASHESIRRLRHRKHLSCRAALSRSSESFQAGPECRS